jgi:hypothetical protein
LRGSKTNKKFSEVFINGSAEISNTLKYSTQNSTTFAIIFNVLEQIVLRENSEKE